VRQHGAKAAIESELRGLAVTSTHRNDALNKAAFSIGQRWGGLIEHSAAHDRLIETAQGIGLMTPDERKKPSRQLSTRLLPA
jgi:hypothetical protein